MKKIAILGMLVLFAVLVLAFSASAPASAEVLEDLHTVKSGTVAGGVYVGGSYGRGTTYTQNFTVPNGNILWSMLYVDVWASGRSSGWLNLTYWNGTGYTENNQYLNYSYDGADNTEAEGYYVGCGYGHYWKYWNVTEITRSGANSVTATTSGFDVGSVSGIALITVYEDGGEEATYWINQGYIHIGNTAQYPCAVSSTTTWFNGTIDTSKNTTLWTIYLTGSDGEPDYLYFNGNQLSDDAADGGGSTPDNTWSSGNWFDIDSWRVNKAWLDSSSNNVTFRNGYPPNGISGETSLRVVCAVLISKEPKPDLNVTEIDTRVEREGQIPIDDAILVANHTYTINATVKNIGSADAGGFNVTLREDGTLRNDSYVSGLDAGNETIVQFDWRGLSGNYTLTVTADAYDAVNESAPKETNNARTKNITVIPDNTTPPDVGLSASDIELLPTYGSNNTTIRVRITNWNTTDANNFNVSMEVRNNTGAVVYTTTKSTSLQARHYRIIEFEYLALPEQSPYTITISVGDVSGETDFSNNTASKSLRVVTCRILDTHHYGDTSAYNGILSNYATVNMFDITKIVPENTTPFTLLNSVADVVPGVNSVADSIDGLKRGIEGGEPFYWYLYVNGVSVSVENNTRYPLRDGEVVHYDIHTYVKNSEPLFSARPVMDYPEPFKHGYNGTVWNTTIVYPSNDPGNEYQDLAHKIKDKLNDTVPDWRISVKTNDTLTSEEKANNNLILLGTPRENNIIEDINTNHSEIGMPVYFDMANNTMINDYTDETIGAGGNVIEACDNPFDNTEPWEDTWMDTGPSIWIVSGMSSEHAKEAAEWLINRTCLLDEASQLDDVGFWLIQYKCGDVSGNGVVTGYDYTVLKLYVGGVPGWELDCRHC